MPPWGQKWGLRWGIFSSRINELFLRQHEPNLKVYYVGENPQKKGDFAQAMEMWNQVENKGPGLPGG